MAQLITVQLTDCDGLSYKSLAYIGVSKVSMAQLITVQLQNVMGCPIRV